jgi:hypothetical protein
MGWFFGLLILCVSFFWAGILVELACLLERKKKERSCYKKAGIGDGA